MRLPRLIIQLGHLYLFAKELFRASKAEFDRAQRAYGSMLTHPDGAHAIRQSIRQQAQAIEEFRAALMDLSDLLLGRARPPN
jgi:hypothetical protein